MRLFPSGRTATVLIACVLLAGCSGEPAPAETPRPQAPTSNPATAVPSPAPEPSADEPTPESVIATAKGETVDIYAEAGADAPDRQLSAEQVVSLPGSIPLTFLVADRSEDWVQVHLPVRPNGSTGWVRVGDVRLSATDYRIEVRITEHRLLLHRGDDVVLDVPVGVGRDEVPTPGGVYYIKELLQPPEPGGPYGAYAYGLSGYSPVLEQFAGGEGVIGIHGTNEPESVGTDASHGCIRMRDEDVTQLVEEFGLPLGTPVEVLA
ncbi:L,D-transpeptidase [Actinotalea sp. C106]|uniref:L,D-transpeptidase n=1 Tax=Actinotalea sp. C106 TaxID=2908644 RepID=UPI00202933F9|nr:L,D-transpeptidase family protein [Actinotalea sp. C106]